MRVRDHALLATVGAALVYPILRRSVVVPWAASILIDADHYLWFVVTTRQWHPAEAVRFYNQAHPPQHVGTKLFHTPGVSFLLLLLAARWRLAALVLLGIAFHVNLDAYHERRLAVTRRAVLRRDRCICQACGVQAPNVVAHLRRQPWLLPSYRIEHFTSLCPTCHEAVHASTAIHASETASRLADHVAYAPAAASAQSRTT